MKSTFFCFLAFVAVGASMLGSWGCDNSEADGETPLPGVGPVGAGGAPYLGAGGSAGAAGSVSGAGGEGGEGGSAGSGGASGVSGSAGTGGAAGEGGAAGAGGAGPLSCTGSGKASVRLGNMRPAAGAIDFCARGAADADFSGAKRLIRELGDAAHDGLVFAEISRAIEVEGAGLQIKVIDAASPDCTGDALATYDLCWQEGDLLSLLMLDGAATLFRDAPATEGNRLRFIHAYAGEGPLDVGLVDETDNTLLMPAVFPAVAYGKIPTETTPDFTLLPTGYIDLDKSYDAVIAVGAALTGTPKALFITTLDFAIKGRALTAFAAGKKDDAAFPLQGYLCEESKPDGVLTSCTKL